ncbi:MAG TPA: pyridoxal phosphate-dependent aminotransferase [Candidatus Nitrosotenuis sp.]|nr:pyridoxal phosphate-dependent aminotransferase [Candidatus Nitrosotenuis sp.]
MNGLKFVIDQYVEDMEMPENLKLNTFVKEFHQKCSHRKCNFGTYGFSFGQSPFPVPSIMQKALAKNTDKGKYSFVSGILPLREAISEYNKYYFGLDIDPRRILVGNGTKQLIYNILELLHGTVILPTPTWLGYLPQIRFLKKNYHMLPTRKNNGKIMPETLRHLALRLHDRQKILFLNNPNNPTGLLYSRLELEEIVDICRMYNIIVIADEIYAQTTYDFDNFVSMAEIYPEGSFVTNGLSKSHSAGGYRLGYVILPHYSSEIKPNFKKIQATEYTSVSTPIQYAAIAGFQPSKELNKYFEVARNIHRIMGEYCYDTLNDIDGVRTTKPEATFYLLADFNSYRDYFHSRKIITSQQFLDSMLEHPYHTAIVGGESLVLERTDFSTRIAYVDYDGQAAMQNYQTRKPKNQSERLEFVRKNAPRIVSGLDMIKKYLDDIKRSKQVHTRNRSTRRK